MMREAEGPLQHRELPMPATSQSQRAISALLVLLLHALLLFAFLQFLVKPQSAGIPNPERLLELMISMPRVVAAAATGRACATAGTGQSPARRRAIRRDAVPGATGPDTGHSWAWPGSARLRAGKSGQSDSRSRGRTVPAVFPGRMTAP